MGFRQHLYGIGIVARVALKALPHVLGFLALAALLASFLRRAAADIYEYLGLASERLTVWAKVSTIVYMLGAAAMLAEFKRASQKWCGVVECAFAVAVAWRVLSAQMVADRFQNTLALLATAYVMSRGFANYQDGRNADARKGVDKLSTAQ